MHTMKYTAERAEITESGIALTGYRDVVENQAGDLGFLILARRSLRPLIFAVPSLPLSSCRVIFVGPFLKRLSSASLACVGVISGLFLNQLAQRIVQQAWPVAFCDVALFLGLVPVLRDEYQDRDRTGTRGILPKVSLCLGKVSTFQCLKQSLRFGFPGELLFIHSYQFLTDLNQQRLELLALFGRYPSGSQFGDGRQQFFICSDQTIDRASRCAPEPLTHGPLHNGPGATVPSVEIAQEAGQGVEKAPQGHFRFPVVRRD